MTSQRNPNASAESCVHQPACPGCPRYGDPRVPKTARVSLEEFCRAAGCQPEWVSGEPFGYRGRARLAIRGTAIEPQVGVFEKGSHRIVDIPECAVHHPLVNRVAEACRGATRSSGIQPYSERSHTGALRYLQVVRERASGLVQVVLVANAKTEVLAPFLSEFRGRLGGELHSLFVSENSERTNSILGPRMTHVWGPAATIERIGGADVYFPPDAFGQANLDLFEDIVQQIHSWVLGSLGNGSVVELYAGVGAIGLGLAAGGATIAFNEIGEGSLRGLRMGLRQLEAGQRANCSIFPGSAAEAVPLLRSAATVIADPPRKGLAPAVVEELCRRARLGEPLSLVYLSCGLSSFLRDSQQLLDNGFHLQECRGYALFPFTDHVETLARFTLGQNLT